jgi:F-type H+-transporting ATPase subunit a
MRRLLWVSLILPAVFNTPRLFLAHLVPKGTPIVLVPFIVIIELIRNIMRPFTLGIRLAANIVAGHLLLVLTSSPVYSLNFSVIGGVLVALFSLTVLELAVSVIQRYVFIRLRSLYVREVSHTTLN